MVLSDYDVNVTIENAGRHGAETRVRVGAACAFL